MELNTSISEVPKVGKAYKSKLEKLSIRTVSELLYHTPHRYIDFRKHSKISRAKIGEYTTIKGKVKFFKNQYTKTKKKVQICEIEDESGKIKLIWFNQPYLISVFRKDIDVSASGEVSWFGREKALISPEYEIATENIHTGRLLPIYPETKGVSSKWIRSRVNFVLQNSSEDWEYLPINILDKYNLINLSQAFQFVHNPVSENEVNEGKKRLAFDELFKLHLASISRKKKWTDLNVSHTLSINEKQTSKFTKILPFQLTRSQIQASKEVLEDMSKGRPMNRLLEGDVGSGKTVVAAFGAYNAFLNGFQSVFMAPTQILAQQHFDTLNTLLTPLGMGIKLITSSTSKESSSHTDVYVGTHALIHKKINFKKVSFVVIDEQHRFGVEQRAHLVKKAGGKSYVPHVLTMTATPIPRTAALTVYGDLDLSTLKELPKGRVPISTWVVPENKRESAYEWIEKEVLTNKVQAYIVCPLIDASESESMQQVKSVKIEYEKVKNKMRKLRVGLLHGKLKQEEKESVLKKFRNGEINVLVTTPVVEVGVDVPNATIMVIEGADRFGLAQLHQLRGRVGRGKKKSYCLLFSESKAKNTISRLEALKQTRSGFELAELDLQLRGPGEIFGMQQHGFPQLKTASWADIDLVTKSKEAAEFVINNLENFPKIQSKIKSLLH